MRIRKLSLALIAALSAASCATVAEWAARDGDRAQCEGYPDARRRFQCEDSNWDNHRARDQERWNNEDN